MTDTRSTPCSATPARLRPTMRASSSSASATERVVRKRLADGTVKEYRYPRQRTGKAPRIASDSLAALLIAYRRSTEWEALKPNSRAHYTRYLRHLEDAWEMPLKALTRKLLLSMRDEVAHGFGPAAGNCFIQATSAVFYWARKRGWVEYSPVDRVTPIETGHFPAWSMEEVAVALERFPEPLRRVVTLALYTGQRRGDLIKLPWSAYDGVVVKLRQQKKTKAGNAMLVIPVHSELRAALERWKADRVSPLILTTARGLAWSGTHLSTAMAQAVRNAALPAQLNVHGLRKLAAARLAEAGCSTLEIASITGHRSLSMISLYTASAQQAVLAAAAIERLETAVVKLPGNRRATR